MIPVRDTQWRGSTPRVTYALIVINVLVFLLMFSMDSQPQRFVAIADSDAAERALSGSGGLALRDVQVYPLSERDEFTLQFGAVPEFLTEQIRGQDASQRLVQDFRLLPNGQFQEGAGVDLLFTGWLVLLTPLTAMFLHGGILHLLGNMLFLWVFADNVEDRLGHGRFALFYALTGYLAAAAHIVLGGGDLVPMVGASGAISGVLGAYLLLFPRSMVQVFFFVILLIPAVIPAPLMIGLWFLTNLINGLGSIAAETTGSGGTAWFAHLGGFLAGMALIYPFLVGRWRAPAQTVGPTWNLPPGFFGGQRRGPPRSLMDPPPAPPEEPERPPRERRRARFLRRVGSLPHRRRRGGVDAYRRFPGPDR